MLGSFAYMEDPWHNWFRGILGIWAAKSLGDLQPGSAHITGLNMQEVLSIEGTYLSGSKDH